MTMSWKEACKRIIVAAEERPSPRQGAIGLDYAAAYAKAALDMTDPEELRVQVMYILTNLSNWRGQEARTVKARLREIAKQNGKMGH